jgi:hypothetical protein
MNVPDTILTKIKVTLCLQVFCFCVQKRHVHTHQWCKTHLTLKNKLYLKLVIRSRKVKKDRQHNSMSSNPSVYSVDQLMWCVLVYIKPISLTTKGDQNNSIEAHWYYSELHSRGLIPIDLRNSGSVRILFFSTLREKNTGFITKQNVL